VCIYIYTYLYISKERHLDLWCGHLSPGYFMIHLMDTARCLVDRTTLPDSFLVHTNNCGMLPLRNVVGHYRYFQQVSPQESNFFSCLSQLPLFPIDKAKVYTSIQGVSVYELRLQKKSINHYDGTISRLFSTCKIHYYTTSE
jgi:hypothetical protein